MQQPVARLGDPHQCPEISPVLVPHASGPITKGSNLVMANNLPVARVDDEISCVSSTAKVKKGAQNIVVDNKPMAHVNAESDHGGKVTQGSQNVYVGPRKPVQESWSSIAVNRPNKKNLHIKSINTLSNDVHVKVNQSKVSLPAEGTVMYPLQSDDFYNSPIINLFNQDLNWPHTIKTWPMYSEDEYRMYIKQSTLSKKVDLEPEHQLVILEATTGKPASIQLGHHQVNDNNQEANEWLKEIIDSMITNGMPAIADTAKLLI